MHQTMHLTDTCLRILTNDAVDCIMVVKRNKGKAPLVAGLVIYHDVNGVDFAELFKVVAQVALICIFLDATDKDFLHCDVSARSV